MKKIAVSTVAIAAFIIYAIFNHKSQTQPVTVSTGTGKTQTTQSATIQSEQTSPTSIPVSTPTSQTYKDGTYTGKATDAFYGNIQVKVIISGGKISDVQFLQYPNDQRESIEINTEAMPVLTQEAINAQNANVDIVSRATDSSQAFKESLASALSQAQ